MVKISGSITSVRGALWEKRGHFCILRPNHKARLPLPFYVPGKQRPWVNSE